MPGNGILRGRLQDSGLLAYDLISSGDLNIGKAS
jgi:hypothetical protein